MKHSALLLMAAASVILSGCVGAAIGAGATVGVKAAQEGGLRAAVSDASIEITINDLWFKYNVETFAKLNLTVNQGRVLITGIVQNPEARVEAVRLAWQADGVKEVINEIRVANSEGITGYARDTWITARLRTTLTFDRNIQSINYSIDTVQGIVYLMGVAQNQAELNRVLGIARTVPDVKQVVSYVKMVGEPVQGEKPQSNGMLTAPGDGMAPMQDGTNNGMAPMNNDGMNNNGMNNNGMNNNGMNNDGMNNGGMNNPPQSGNYQPETYESRGNRPPTPLVPEPVQQEPINNGGY